MPAQIEIKNIEVELKIGCHENERERSQPVIFSIKILNYKKFKASKTDKLEDTIDVSQVKKIIKDSIKDVTVHTLERLAELIEVKLIKNFPYQGLTWELTISKKNYNWNYVQSWST